MSPKRPFWTFVILAAAAVLVLNALTGTSSSPLPRLLHISRVPGWWPLVLAAGTGVALGTFFNRNRAAQKGDAPAARPGKGAGVATRGRHAVPRSVRRARERDARRRDRLEQAEAAARAEEEAARRAAEASAAPPPPQGPLARVRAVLRRGAGSRQ